MNASSASGLWPIRMVCMGVFAGQATTDRRVGSLEREVALTEPETKVAGPDGADDSVARARRIDLDPGAPGGDRLVGGVRGDLPPRGLRRSVDGGAWNGGRESH